MHISEGVLSGPVLISGAVLAAVGTAIALKKMDQERIPQTAVMSAAFFVASLIHVPIGPSNAHLILNGMVGLLLGWGAFPAILIALCLQGVLFQFGGITTLGVNTLIMAGPALLSYYFFAPLIHRKNAAAYAGAFLCGFMSVLFSGILAAAALMFTEEKFFDTVLVLLAAHLPVMVIEGVVTVFCVNFLKKVSPELLPGAALYAQEPSAENSFVPLPQKGGTETL